MMNDLRHIGEKPNRKVARNRIKVRKDPIDLRLLLLPAIRYGGRAGLLLLVGGLLAAAIKGLLQATPFPVQKVDVRGVQRLTTEEIVGLTGVEPGQNLMHVRLKQVGQQVARSPWVASVRVQRFFPGTLAISITERKPVAVVNLGLLYYLDSQGEPFKPLSFGDTLDLPVVTGMSEEGLAADPGGTRETLRSACELLGALQQHGSFILADVSEIHYDRAHGFTLFTTSGAVPIRIGTDDFTGKLDRFARIYQTLMTQQPGLHYIDLDYSDRIIVKKS